MDQKDAFLAYTTFRNAVSLQDIEMSKALLPIVVNYMESELGKEKPAGVIVQSLKCSSVMRALQVVKNNITITRDIAALWIRPQEIEVQNILSLMAEKIPAALLASIQELNAKVVKAALWYRAIRNNDPSAGNPPW